MDLTPLGRTLVIANPSSHSGDGALAIRKMEQLVADAQGPRGCVEVRSTTGAGDARVMASEAAGKDCVIALGGDGLVHEVVQGLMAIEERERPCLGVIAVGSGNDYARTLGMASNDVVRAVEQLTCAMPRSLDLGHVTSDAGEDQFFMETLSFGMDAAIAIDTTRRRRQQAHQKGEGLYVTSALGMLGKAGRGHACTASFDGEAPRRLRALIMALQVGPTYGGGFAICPEANPTDGLLDACYNVRHPSLPHLALLLALARFGRHAGSKVIETRRFTRATLSFEEEPPCQADGEELRGRRFEVEVRPGALKVLAPRPV